MCGQARPALLALGLLAAGAAAAQEAPVPPPGMIPVQGGAFLIGSPTGEGDTSEIRHEVRVTGFLLGRYEVTQAEWLEIMDGLPSTFTGDPRLPVDSPSWFDCVEYCNLRSLREGISPCYALRGRGRDPRSWPEGWKQGSRSAVECDWSADGYRLPTDAEWEYACRAGTTTRTPFGDDLSSTQANFNGVYPLGKAPKGPFLGRTTPVGSYPPNPWGFYDMLGNLREWCWDRFAAFSTRPAVDPRGPGSGEDTDIRNSSWMGNGDQSRSACRAGHDPAYRCMYFGFRLARAMPDAAASP